MNSKLEGAISGVLAVAAIAIAVSVVHRTFFAPTVASAAVRSMRPEFLPSWKEALPIGIMVGDSAAPVKIVELTDLECPACRGFNGTLQKVLKAHPHDVSMVYVSFPLTMHRFAMSAARGAECANSFGKFHEWANVMFEKQDSLGLKSWGSYAADAGIPDTASISKCVTNPAPVSRIEAGLAYGAKIHLAGTPTVIVNGWRFPNTPTEKELTDAVAALEKGAVPFDTTAQ